MTYRRGLAAAVLAAMGLMERALQAAVPDSRVTLEIKSQPLRDALSEFGRQSGLQVVFVYTDIDQAVMASELEGTYEPQVALQHLLANTALGYEFINARTVAIRLREVGAVSSALGRSSTASDAGDWRMAQAETASGAIQGQERGEDQKSSAPASEGSAAEVKEVIVTGTRFSGRTALTSPVPVDLVSAEDLRGGGRTELAEALSATVPAFNFHVVSPAGTISAMRPFSYRGLPPQQVLVLVNGKRWHPTATGGMLTFDFNSIPPTSVGSVEVLRDGASAQYGSDAIAGVINVRLRRDTRTELTASTGQYYAGDGLTTEVALDTGLTIGNDGFAHVSAYYRDVDQTNRQGRDVRQQYFARDTNGNPVVLPVVGATDSTPVLPAGFTFDPREFTGVDRLNNFIDGNASRREAGLNFNAELPISDAMTAYGFGGYTDRVVDTPFVWRRPMDNNTVRAIFPNGFEPIYHARISDVQAAAGFKGTVGAWDWDVSESWGFSKLSNYAENTLNASLGTASATDFFGGSQRSAQATTNVDFRRALDVGLGSPLNMAFGSEFRLERIRIQAGEPASYINGGVPVLDGPSAGAAAPIGAQGIAGYTPADAVSASRNSIAGYVDIENQLTDKLLATLAGRYEHYSDIGSTVNGKLSFLEQFTPVFALRGSVSTGFRAPALIESYYSSTGSLVVGGQFFISRTFPVGDPVAQTLGAIALEPEKSLNYSFGTTLTFSDRLNFTADVYRVYVRDAIITSSFFNDAGTRAFLASQGFTGINSASFATNAVDKRVDGLDVAAHYTLAFDGGTRLMFSGAANFNDPRVTSVKPTPPQLAAVTTIPLFNQQRIVATEQGAPRTRINTSLAYSYRNLQMVLRETRYGSTRERASALTDQVFDAKWVTDLDVSYDVNDTLQLTVGGQNLFDVYPEKLNSINNPAGALAYPFNIGNAPFGISGGYYYARALLRF